MHTDVALKKTSEKIVAQEEWVRKSAREQCFSKRIQQKYVLESNCKYNNGTTFTCGRFGGKCTVGKR